MGNKKIWAYGKYGKDELDPFIRDDKGRLKLFFIWQVNKLKKNDFFEFEKLTYFSTQRDENKRKKMYPVINGFFRYGKNSGGRNNYTGDGESLSHSIAIVVLSELETINFVFGNKEVSFEIADVQTEDITIKFESGNAYVPDLMVYFKPGNPYYEKWGGKVAVEVNVTHECEPKKVKEFLEHNIPIIEINITKRMQFLKELNKQAFDETDMENHYNWLKSRLSNKVYGKILSDPMSKEYVKEKMSQVNDYIHVLKKDIEHLNEQSESMKKDLSTRDNEISYLQQELHEKNEDVERLKQKHQAIVNRTFIQKIVHLFK